MSGNNNEPPAILVKTWIEMIRSSEDENVRARASQMLIEAFGDMKNAAEFAAKHKLFKA